jgi:nicotinamidase-related amidase
MRTNLEWIAVDIQKDFTDPKGLWFVKGDSISFIKNTLFPFFYSKRILVSEILSDYRAPRNGKSGLGCDPNQIGFQSELPSDIVKGKPWVKCMHNPLWTRDNAGVPNMMPGKPVQDPNGFNEWLQKQIGKPKANQWIILFGETLEVCVAATAQELNARGYCVKILYEATDPMNERLMNKDWLIDRSTIRMYADIIRFEDVLNEMDR